jgi:hypothetical protein
MNTWTYTKMISQSRCILLAPIIIIRLVRSHMATLPFLFGLPQPPTVARITSLYLWQWSGVFWHAFVLLPVYWTRIGSLKRVKVKNYPRVRYYDCDITYPIIFSYVETNLNRRLLFVWIYCDLDWRRTPRVIYHDSWHMKTNFERARDSHGCFTW